MTLKIRYMTSKYQISTIRMSIESTFQDLLDEVNKKNKTTEYKYVYSKEDGCNINEEELIRDYYNSDETLFYILKDANFDKSDFESYVTDPVDPPKTENPDDDPPKKKEGKKSSDSTSSENEDPPKTENPDDDPPKKKEGKKSSDSTSSENEDPPKKKEGKKSSDSKNSENEDPTIEQEEQMDELLQTRFGNVFKIVLKAKHTKANFENSDEFYIYSTQSYERMTHPVKIKIPLDSSYDETEQKIREELEIPDELQTHIYLSSGVRFFKNYKEEKNKLGNFFNNTDTNHNIYVVITEKIKEEILEQEIDEVCNAENDDMKSLISPICRSTIVGYSRMACLLGTFFYKGMKTLNFIRSIARCTGFAPLVSCLLALDDRDGINGLTIATITASLHTIFSKLLEKSTVKKENIFERCLECACYLVHVENTYIHACEHEGKEPIQIVINKIDVLNDSDEITRYLLDCNQKNSFFPYYPDIRYVNDFEIAMINNVPSIKQIEYIFNHYASYRPIPPLSARNIYVTCIIQYINDQTLLLINALDDSENPYSVNIIDPFVGEIETRNVNDIAKEILDNPGGKLELLIDPNDVEEFNAIILDASGSMYSRIEDGLPSKKNDVDRVHVAKKCIRTFLKMSLLYRLPHLFSLSYFNSEVHHVTEFSPLSSEIEKSLIDDSIKFRFNSIVWDAINDAITSLIEIKKTGAFKKAKLRILVFSDGSDNGSKNEKEDVCRRAIDNEIIVDSIIFAIKNSCDDLCNFSHFTGGYVYKSKNENDFYSFFEKESFLKLSLRKKDKEIAKSKDIDDLFDKTEANYDNDIENVEFVTQKGKATIATPNYIMGQCYKIDKSEFHRYQLRLLKEMRIFELKEDKEIKLFIKYFDIKTMFKHDKKDEKKEEEGILSWKVFMKGPKNTHYEDHWWFLSIMFTKDYPLQPPLFRFIKIPYHINVSEDGRICSSFLLSNYNANESIYDLVVKVRDLLANPEEKYAIQEYKLNLFNTNIDKFNEKVDEYNVDAYDSLDDVFTFYDVVEDKTGFSASENDFEDNDDFISNVSQVFIKTIKNPPPPHHHDEEEDIMKDD